MKNSIKGASQQAKSAVQDHVERAAPGLELLARFGYFCKGVIYIAIAVLALGGARTAGRTATDQRGVLDYLGRTTISDVLLMVLAFGLLGYCIWQLIRALLDPERKGTKAKGLLKRAGYLISAITYGSLAWAAWRVAYYHEKVSNQRSEENWTAMLMNAPAGQWLVGLVALVFFGIAANQIFIAIKASFMKHMSFVDLGSKRRNLLKEVGQVGILARGLVMGMVGWLFLQAALHLDPNKAGGLSEAIKKFETAPGGIITYMVLAVGMLLYGLFAWIQAAYRRIRIEKDTVATH